MGSKIDANFEGRFFKQTLFFLRKNHDFRDPIGPSWEQKPSKNRTRNEAQNTLHLSIDFLVILFGFGYQVGAKLALKSNKIRSHKQSKI